MEDDSKSKTIAAYFLGALGLGAVATAVAVPKYGLWLALVIILLAVLIFGIYFLFRRIKSRRQSRSFEGAIEAQTAASPRAISDPNRRAALDKLRQKFQTGIQEFKSRGKDIYKLPWYVIIGEPGSGKTEAIRHSGIEFPPGLQDELQGSGGTVNMDWWFTNRSIILDTAGSMIFNEAQAGEAPEWREFLRLLKKGRPHCPINGLFLVLSIESLIKDSADKIAQKASKLAQQLDMIQRTLDVRFPVYLLVTKCDLLTGFREFFDNIDDPLLQHQMFGWSNPDPLDTHFRPELVEQHLKTVAESIRRRRLALLRESGTSVRFGETAFFTKGASGVVGKRRLDEVDSLYALPESVTRLAPRLRRYLETIFVAGEWSAKPVFLRGIYFTSSMREGRALDEAMALATGVSLEQLPEDRPWEKNRSYFMRDLFLEKVFREYGLVTRATNTLQLVRKRKLLIFGVATFALMILLGFSFMSYRSLKRSVLAESGYWNAGATNWNNGEWSPPIVRAGSGNPYHFTYAGNEVVPDIGGLTEIQYQTRLMEIADKRLSVGLIFKPMAWLTSGKDMNRPEARRALFEGGVLKPLVNRTRDKIEHQSTLTNPALIALHREALLSLIRLEADSLAGGGSLTGTNAAAAAARYIQSFQSYLMDTNQPADTNLVAIMVQTYAGGKGSAKWPPAFLLGGNSLADNLAVSNGLTVFRMANQSTQNNIKNEAGDVGELADALQQYQQTEKDWQSGKLDSTDPAAALLPGGDLLAAKAKVDAAWMKLNALTNSVANATANLTAHYDLLKKAAIDASANVFQGIAANLPEASKTSGLFADINLQLTRFASEAAANVQQSYDARTNWLAGVDLEQMTLMTNGTVTYQARWQLYQSACKLAQGTVSVDQNAIGTEWKEMLDLKKQSDAFQLQLTAYNGPLAQTTVAICQRIAAAAQLKIKNQLVDDYSKMTAGLLTNLFRLDQWSADHADDSRGLLDRISRDLKAAGGTFSPDDLAKLQLVSRSLLDNCARLQSKLGFPVLLDSDRNLTIADMSALRNMLEPLMTALNNPSWDNLLDDTSRERAHRVAQNLEKYNDVVSALLNADGRPATVEVFFVPPKADADIQIISAFRQVDVALGDADSGWQEISGDTSGDPVSLVKGTVGGTLNINFRRLSSDPAPVTADNQASWALVRLIHGGQVDRSDNGLEWTQKIKLNDTQQNISGIVAFKFVTKGPLPKPEDWPRE